MDIVGNLLFIATGIRHSSSQQTTVAAIWEVIVNDLRCFVSSYLSQAEPSAEEKTSTAAQNDIPLSIIQFLGKNEESLHRFARRMILMDTVNENTDLDGQTEITPGVYESSLRSSLKLLNWADDVIDEFLRRPNGPVKTARLVRADCCTRDMNDATYKAFCEARLSSFYSGCKIPGKGKRKVQTCPANGELFAALDLIPTTVSGVILAYFASECLYMIVELILILRVDARDGSFLRYQILKGESRSTDVISCLTNDRFDSVITVDEVRNMARLFCSQFTGDIQTKSLLISI